MIAEVELKAFEGIHHLMLASEGVFFLQATSLPRERIKEFQSEAQRHTGVPVTRYPHAHPPDSASSTYSSQPMAHYPPAYNTRSHTANNREPAGYEKMTTGVQNMSIQDNRYPPQQSREQKMVRAPDPGNGLVRSNSFQ